MSCFVFSDLFCWGTRGWSSWVVIGRDFVVLIPAVYIRNSSWLACLVVSVDVPNFLWDLPCVRYGFLLRLLQLQTRSGRRGRLCVVIDQ